VPRDGHAPDRPRRALLLRSIDTLSARLAVLFALLVLPPTAVCVNLAWNSFVENLARARLQVRHLATLTANYESKFFEDVQERLQEIGDDPEFRGGPGKCQRVLDEAVKATEEFAAVGFYAIGGTRICGTDDVFDRVADLDWLTRVRRFHSFAISDYTPVPDADHPVIIAAQAVYGRDGGFEGVLAASIRLYWLSAFIREVTLPPESVFYLVDGNGTVLADRTFVSSRFAERRSGDAPGSDRADSISRIIGEEAAATVLEQGRADFEATGPDGTRRVFSSVLLPHGDVTVLFGMPAISARGWLERDLLHSVLGLAAIWCAGIGAAWLGTRYLVTRWTGRLDAMALAYGQGRYHEAEDFSNAPRELRDLAQTLTLMAGRIEEREDELRTSLEQKNVLLKEIHHRVKNNLQIVSSLINIRGAKLSSEADRGALEEVKAQVRALALAHSHLYEGDDVQHVQLKSFLSDLCRRTFDIVACESGRVSLALDLPEVRLATDRAVPLALMVTEAITNAVKHAFPDGRTGTIRVGFERSAEGAGVLTIADDGVGIGQDAGKGGGIGLGLIEALVRQVGGTVSFAGPPGTVISVEIPLEDGAHDDASDPHTPVAALPRER